MCMHNIFSNERYSRTGLLKLDVPISMDLLCETNLTTIEVLSANTTRIIYKSTGIVKQHPLITSLLVDFRSYKLTRFKSKIS